MDRFNGEDDDDGWIESRSADVAARLLMEEDEADIWAVYDGARPILVASLAYRADRRKKKGGETEGGA